MFRSAILSAILTSFFLSSSGYTQTIQATTEAKAYNIKKNAQSVDQSRTDYALLVANENFLDQGYSRLNNPKIDIVAIEKILREQFGFKTEIITDITKDACIKKLREYAGKSYGKYDQLLIYFAGHGDFDPLLRQGYVVMNDSKNQDETYSKHFSFPELQNIVTNLRCNHILLTLDVCYGGTFDSYFATTDEQAFRGDDRGAKLISERSEMMESLTAFTLEKLRPNTRLYLSAGGKEVVSDGKKGEHSPFAKAFLEKLSEAANSSYKILTVAGLKDYLEKQTRKVKMNGFGSNQSNSDFLFVAK
jgi:hypothetical protein